MTHEQVRTPFEQAHPRLELAGSLQAILHDIPNRDFSLDVQQEEALQAVGEALVEGVDSGYLEMATSSGKTAVEALVAEAAVRSGKRVLMLAPTIAIANQLQGQGRDTVTGLERFTGLNQTSDVRMHAGGRRGNASAQVVITTYPGFLSDAKNGHQKLGEFDVVIADECHRSLGAETSDALRNAFPGAFKVGLSATPDFAVDRKSEEVYEHCLFEFSLPQSVELGRTAPVRALVYETDEVLTTNDPRREFTDRELAPLIHNEERNGTALALTRAFVEDGRQGLIACVPGKSNMHAQLMTAVLEEAGIPAADVGSHLPLEEQLRRLKAYENGDIKVLTFTRALEEGWDSQKASFAINLAPTTSPVRTKQLLGRVLRRKESGLDSIYVDFLDKRDGIARKDQYTAMHALDLETIDLTRILGGPAKHISQFHGEVLQGLERISQKVYARLCRNQGRLLADITVRPTTDPLVREWERRLESEGMPAELPYNSVLKPTLANKVLRFCMEFEAANGEQPSLDDMLEKFEGKLSNADRKALAHYAMQEVYVEGMQDDLPARYDDQLAHPYDFVMRDRLLPEQLLDVLDTLGERERDIVEMCFGIRSVDGQPVPMQVAAKKYGITRGRVSQIEAAALSRLRHPSRSEVLYGYAEAPGVRPRHWDTDEATAPHGVSLGGQDSNHRYLPRNREEMNLLNDKYRMVRRTLSRDAAVFNDEHMEAIRKHFKSEQAFRNRIRDIVNRIGKPAGYDFSTIAGLKTFFRIPLTGEDLYDNSLRVDSIAYVQLQELQIRMQQRYGHETAGHVITDDQKRGMQALDLLTKLLSQATKV